MQPPAAATRRPHGPLAARTSWLALGTSLGLALHVATIPVGVDLHRNDPAPAWVEEAPPSAVTTVAGDPPEPAPTAPAPAEPVEVHIGTLGLTAPVIALGLNPDRTLEVPADYDVTGWWSGGPKPGEPGPAVIVGHVDSTDGPAVFYELEQLAPGDEIAVLGADGAATRFVVERGEWHSKADFPTEAVYGDTPEPELRLITCAGEFDRRSRSYQANYIVFAGQPDSTGGLLGAAR